MNGILKTYLNKLILLVLISISVSHVGCGKKDKKVEQPDLSVKQPVVFQDSFKKPAKPKPPTISIHVFVALADNKSQGIVPVPGKLGDGNDPHNNLYWGALYGVKTFFRKDREWNFVAIEKNLSEKVLERCIFCHKEKNVILIADAYRGSMIKKTLIDFMNALAGKNPEHIDVKGTKAGINGGADLAVYVGHNVLMDFKIRATGSKAEKRGVPAIVLACKSKQYFLPWLVKFNSKPVLMTTGLMAPEAYTLKAAFDACINGGSIKEKAAQAYNRYQSCGLNAARNLFYSE